MSWFRVLHPFKTRRARQNAQINRTVITGADLIRWAAEDRHVTETKAGRTCS